MAKQPEYHRGNIFADALRQTKQMPLSCWSTALINVLMISSVWLLIKFASRSSQIMSGPVKLTTLLVGIATSTIGCLLFVWAHLYLGFLTTAKGGVAQAALARGEKLTSKKVASAVRAHSRALRGMATRVLAVFLKRCLRTCCVVSFCAALCAVAAIAVEGTTELDTGEGFQLALGIGIVGMVFSLIWDWLRMRVETAGGALLVARDHLDAEAALAAAKAWVAGRRLRLLLAQLALHVVGGFVIVLFGGFLALGYAGMRTIGLPGLVNAWVFGAIVSLAAAVTFIRVAIRLSIALVPISAMSRWNAPLARGQAETTALSE